MVPIAEFEGSFDAELAKLALDKEGIESVVFGEDLVTMLPHINAIRVELRVFEPDVERAKQVLAEMEPLEDNDSNEQET
ncbi:MAG: putative signal transducing protein [Planctomycetota bacterium]